MRQTPCAAPQAEGLDKPAGEPVPVPAAAGAAAGAALAAGASSGAAAAEGGSRGSRAAAPPSPSAAAAGWTGLASCCLAQRSLLGPAWNHLKTTQNKNASSAFPRSASGTEHC